MTILRLPPTASNIAGWVRDTAGRVNQLIAALAGYQPLDEQLTDLAGLAYTGNAAKVIAVTSGEDGFELVAQSAGSGLADGDYGDIVVSGTGTVLSLDTGVVTAFAKTFLDDANAGAVRTTLGLGTLATQSGTFSGTSSGTNTGDQTITLTGDVTGSGTGSFAATIGNDAVTYPKMQNVSAASKLLGRGSASGSGDPEEITLGTALSMSGTTLNASGGAWALAGTGQTATGVYDFAVDGAKANIDFIGLASFNEILVIARGLTDGTSSTRCLRASVDNGSTFYSASGDYINIDTAGVETATTVFGGHSTNSTAARSFITHILNTKGAAKAAIDLSSTATERLFVASASDINALRVTNIGGGNITAGTVRVYAR